MGRARAGGLFLNTLLPPKWGEGKEKERLKEGRKEADLSSLFLGQMENNTQGKKEKEMKGTHTMLLTG